MHLITLGGGSTQGLLPEGPLDVGMAGWGYNWSKMEQAGGLGWGRMGHEGIPVGPEGVRCKDLTRAAWGNQLDPTDLVWRREDDS